MRYRILLVLLVWVTSALCGFLALRSNLSLESYARSFRENRTASLKPDPRILLVGLDDAVFEYGIFKREVHAHVLGVLKEHGARIVFYDVIFDEDREPEIDAKLSEAIQAWPAVVLGGNTVTVVSHEDENYGQVLPPRLAPALSDAVDKGSAVLGLVERPADINGTLQTYFLAIGTGDSIHPSAALSLYSLLNSVRPHDLRYRQDFIELPAVSIPVEKVVSKAGEASEYIFPLKFHRAATGPGHEPREGTYRVISYTELLEPSDEVKDMLKGAIVIIGENTSGSDDIVDTSVGQMKGFEAHAQCLDRLLNHDFYTFADEVTNYEAILLLTGLVSALGLLTWPLPLLLAGGLVIPVSYAALNLWLFEQRHFEMALAAPVLGAMVALASLILVRVLLASRFLSRFIPVEASRGLLMAKQVAQATNSTVIVSDIRGYTTLSESKTPTEILKMLNEYHSVTVEIYQKHGGNVLTFQGDAQLIVFGFPKALKDPVGQAVKATVEVMEAIAELRGKWGIDDPSKFDVGAGICSGVVYIGDIGSKEQANYTVIGEVVRTSHKVQSMSEVLEGNVLMDEASWERCKDKPQATAIPEVQLEGFPEKKTIYRVESLGPDDL